MFDSRTEVFSEYLVIRDEVRNPGWGVRSDIDTTGRTSG
ncbi:hypothetical protein GRAN_1413 [Granulicella sibirica]|uniref:Uncharacterized protein n=1 Tax=Granulicella sibirica TaxID=2479048 RepID=A0A4Q0T3E0_9BACT|nr:hypothetical protein GRAN_1413 [Granulicella sibirica]